MDSFDELKEVVRRLRAEDGCPWDREQTHGSLKAPVIEEAAEVICGINIYEQTGNAENLKEELGDLLLQVIMQAQIAEEEGIFSLDDVVRGITEKMIRRHPHVFGNANVRDAEEVLVNWEEIKRLVESGGVTYASTNILINQKILAVPQLNGCKFISGANLCINLTDPQKTFPFYNPPGARGEDTFLSTLLQERTVLKIPCYTFHDGFSSYQYLLEGSLPLQLKPITSEAAEINERFLNACIGWIRYKPLLVYIIDKDNYEQRMKAIRKALDATLPIISAFFTDDRFLDILTEFDRYVSGTENHYRLFQTVQNTWARIVREIE